MGTGRGRPGQVVHTADTTGTSVRTSCLPLAYLILDNLLGPHPVISNHALSSGYLREREKSPLQFKTSLLSCLTCFISGTPLPLLVKL